MLARIQGMAWVTPLGVGLDEVWDRLANDERAEVREISSPQTSPSTCCRLWKRKFETARSGIACSAKLL